MDQGTGATIMVVGDDSSFCYLMRRYARKSTHRTVFAYLCEEALALARREKPAVVVLEVGRPGTMGWSVLRALRADQSTRDIPVVLCSWWDEEEQGLEEGADVYLRKPILYEDFLTALTDIGIQNRPQQPLEIQRLVRMKKILSYVAAYLLWIVTAALGVWFMFISRNVFLGALALYAGDSVQRAWQARFFDKVFAIAIGLLWLAAMIVVEVYFRRGVQHDALLGRFVKVAGPEFLIIFVADAFLLWLQRGSADWLRWLILGGELALGVALVWLARSAKMLKSGKTGAGKTA